MRNESRYPVRQRYTQNRPSRGRAPRWHAPISMVILGDVFAAVLLLLVFYITNYMITPDVQGIPLGTPSSAATAIVSATDTPISSADPAPSNAAGQPSATPADTQQQTATATPTPSLPGLFRAKFADKFTSGDVQKTDTTYKSANANVSIEEKQVDGVVYRVADIYVVDPKYLKTSFGATNKLGQRDFVDVTLQANGGIVGINGDNCLDNPCLLIRNGIYYNKFTKTGADALVMYNDGSMETIPNSQLNMNAVKAKAPYQVWGFGPILLTNGQPATKFNSPDTIGGANPRTAIGYYEPGHYCFVSVDGRSAASKGYKLADLANLFYNLGCKEAFNLDGGGSSAMGFMGSIISNPCSDYRKTYDMIYITDKDN